MTTLLEPDASIDRRSFILGGASLALLVGCGSNDDDASATTAGTRLTDDRGELTFDAVPTRIVTTSEEVTELVVALGLQPVGIASGRLPAEPGADDAFVGYYLTAQQIGDAAFVGLNDPLNLESIASLDPDLIIHYENSDAVTTLQTVAATAVYDVSVPGAWQVALTNLGKGLGRSAQALAAIDSYRTEVMDAAEQLSAVAADAPRIAVLLLDYRGGGNNMVLGNEFALASVFPELGFEVVGLDQTEIMAPGVGSISVERLADITADVFLLLDFGEVAPSPSDAILAASGAPIVHVSIGSDRPSAGPLTSRQFLQQYVDALLTVTS